MIKKPINEVQSDEQVGEDVQVPEKKFDKKEKGKLKNLRSKVDELELSIKEEIEKNDELTDKLQRIAAEYDNYRKRTILEKESLYKDATCDCIKEIIPIVDNFERAIATAKENIKDEALMLGFEMIYKQYMDILFKMGLTKIDAKGLIFDPNYHYAILHVEDDSYGDNEVVEEIQAGYLLKERVIRHSLVKVAN